MRTRALLLSVVALAACGDNLAAPPDAPHAMHLTGVAPAQGPLPGGTTIVVGGDGFDPLAPPEVLIGLAPATEVGVVDPFTLTATTPAGPGPGPVDLLIAGDGGYARLDRGFAYEPLPAITTLLPAVGDAAGGTQVMIVGSGFVANDAGPPTVRFGDRDATDVAVLGDGLVIATSPPGAPFVATSVTVTNRAGTSAPLPFRYVAAGLVIGGNYNGPGDGIFYMDPATGLVSEIQGAVDSPWASDGIRSLAADGQILWGTTNYYSHVPMLFVFDPATLVGSTIGAVTNTSGSPLDCLDLELVGGTLYCTVYGALYSIDRTTAAATMIAPMSEPPYGAALAEVGGTTYALRGGCCAVTTLAPIDVTTGTLGPAMPLTMGGQPLGIYIADATADGDGLDVIASYPFEPQLVPVPVPVQNSSVLHVDVATGVTTMVGWVPFQPTALARFAP